MSAANRAHAAAARAASATAAGAAAAAAAEAAAADAGGAGTVGARNGGAQGAAAQTPAGAVGGRDGQTAQDLELQLGMGGQTQVLHGNFREIASSTCSGLGGMASFSPWSKTMGPARPGGVVASAMMAR